MDGPPTPARVITVLSVRQGADEARADREFWAALPPEQRVALVWRITQELWALKGRDLGEPRFLELLSALSAAEARFMVVGAHAVSLHGPPRATGDLAIWFDPEPGNVLRVSQALLALGAPRDLVNTASLAEAGTVTQIGVAPRRADLRNALSGLEFEPSFARRHLVRLGDLERPFLGRDDLVRNKRATGRPRDLADLESLGED